MYRNARGMEPLGILHIRKHGEKTVNLLLKARARTSRRAALGVRRNAYRLSRIAESLVRTLPLWKREPVSWGQGWIGLRSRNGYMYAVLLTDYYHGYWPKLGVTYWRRSIWIMGVRVYAWRRLSRRLGRKRLEGMPLAEWVTASQQRSWANWLF